MPIVIPPIEQAAPQIEVVPVVISPSPSTASSAILAVGNTTPLTTEQFNLHPISNPVTSDNYHPFPYSGFTLNIDGMGYTFSFSMPPCQTDLALLASTTGVDGQAGHLLKLIGDAMDIANGFKTLSAFGVTASRGAAFNYLDQAGVARSVPSIVLTGSAGTAVSNAVWI